MRIVAAALAFLVTGAYGAEPPSFGLTYNTKEDSSIAFSCRRAGPQELECDFNQTSVRRAASAEDLQKRVAEARSEFRKGMRLSADECKTTDQLIAIFEGKAAPPKGKLSDFNDIERRDTLALGKAIQAACQSPSEDTFLALTRLSHGKEMRTCRVSSNSFSQRFKLAPGSNGRTWVQRSEPEGPCGVVQLNRLEAVNSGTLDLVFWKYVARKAVTNPRGEWMGGSCSLLDQAEYEYDWKGSERALGCDYIKFSPT